MSPAVRIRFSKALQFFARHLGAKIRDARNGQLLGRAFMVTWGGKLHLIGYTGPPVVPVFLSQESLSYSRQAMGFTRHPEVDFERL